MNDETALMQQMIPGGIRVTVPANLSLMTPFVLAEQGDWFEGEIRFVRHWLGAGMTAVDVGANYGLYTLTCAQRVGPEGRVWAYEPASLPRSCLDRSLAENDCVHVRLSGHALSDHAGTARLGVSANAELNSLNTTGGAGETVPLTTLDAEAVTWDRPVDFLKLDAEGEEVRILAGAQRFFATHDPLVMFEYKHGNAINRGLLEAVAALGLALYRHVPGVNALVPLGRIAAADPFLLNVFACRAGRARALAGRDLLIESPVEIPGAPAAAEAGNQVAVWCGRRPWARRFWPQGLSAGTAAGTAEYLSALNDVLQGEDETRPVASRLAGQQRGFAGLRRALTQCKTVPRLLSAARVAANLGERAISVAYLQQAAERLKGSTGGVAQLPDEPFLPADRRHDDLEPGDGGAAALALMVDEPLLERSAFSVYFLREQAGPVLQRIASNPTRTPWGERRLAAARRLLPNGQF